MKAKRVFSGVNCAGLIEAVRALGHEDRRQRRFPALIAPASLKPEVMSESWEVGKQFSGVNCAGLIEAASLLGFRRTRRPVFRR